MKYSFKKKIAPVLNFIIRPWFVVLSVIVGFILTHYFSNKNYPKATSIYIVFLGILRTHKFIYQDTDIVNAMFDESSMACSRMKCEPKVLAQLFVHISSRFILIIIININIILKNLICH